MSKLDNQKSSVFNRGCIINCKLEDQKENFRGKNGKPYLVRCSDCGRENWGCTVATGICAWCGWYEENKKRK